ncbi:MAG: ATP-binding protein, partial [Planctomycetota bacterium]
ILAVYSLAFYSVMREHIDSQFENELRGVLGSLIAAAEVEETEVKWQPLEHSIDFGTHDEFGEVQWVVVGGDDLIAEQRPVSEMANQAQAITGHDFRSRLKDREAQDELTELGSAFNRLLDRQQTAFEQQRRFAGDAAHELRTPITVLLGQIDVTMRRPRSESEYKSNLVSNAMKYSEPGTPVVVRASQTAGQLQIHVIDSGPGIDGADLPQLFDPFFRSNEARRRGIAGTGLGLAIASRIAATLGGSLECESTLGKGSCFPLRLPIAA